MFNRNSTLLFSHIPKTAGSSFKKAVKEYFGNSNTFWDYTLQSSETSDVIRREIYQNRDFFCLRQQLEKREESLVGGHFPFSKYAPLYSVQQMITFVRNPVSQVISHFNHHKNHLKYPHALCDFIKEERFRNVQSKYFNGLDPRLLGFVGITEYYQESLRGINEIFGISLNEHEENVSNYSAVDLNTLDHEIEQTIREYNQEDVKLYEYCVRIFLERMDLLQQGLPYTHGLIQEISSEKVKGVAFQRNSDQAVVISIYDGNRLLDSVIAKDYRPAYKNIGVSRLGYTGFEYKFKDLDLDLGRLRCLVQSTGQELR